MPEANKHANGLARSSQVRQVYEANLWVQSKLLYSPVTDFPHI